MGAVAVKTSGDAVADVRRDQMLAAAAQLIAERGFSETRIADVADRVGASPALVIYYFGTKDLLLTAALRWSESAFYEAAERMLARTRLLKKRLQTLGLVDPSSGPAGRPPRATGGCGSTSGGRRSGTPR